MKLSLLAAAISGTLLIGCGFFGSDDPTPVAPAANQSSDAALDAMMAQARAEQAAVTSGGAPELPRNQIYDTDEDGLIEIDTLERLNAVRYDLDGDGRATDVLAYEQAYPRPVAGMGCPTGCRGYELTADLNFLSADDYASGIMSGEWVAGSGFPPIGSELEPFSALFHGNGHTIRSLSMNNRVRNDSGLFGVTARTSEIRELNIESARVEGVDRVGALAGEAHGYIADVHISGSVAGRNEVGGIVGRGSDGVRLRRVSYNGAVWGADRVGGLVGRLSSGRIESAYVDGTAVHGRTAVGGIVGYNEARAQVDNSYAYVGITASAQAGGLAGLNDGLVRLTHVAGHMDVSNLAGGLIGVNQSTGSIEASYSTLTLLSNPGIPGGAVGVNTARVSAVVWDIDRAGTNLSIASGTDEGAQGYSSLEMTGSGDYQTVYVGFNLDLNGDAVPEDPWDFGTPGEYPLLRADWDGDEQETAAEFGSQHRRP